MFSSRLALAFALLTTLGCATTSAQHVGATDRVQEVASPPAPAPDAEGHVGAWANVDDFAPPSH